MKPYRIPSHLQRTEYVIKKSRFITTIGHCPTKVKAKELLEQLRQTFPDARHHCWAMMTGTPWDAHQWDQSDDGEPKGTAGKPMLNVLQHQDIGEVMVIVTRYFGGIKLGAGGLVRAYSTSVQQAVSQLETKLKVPAQMYAIRFNYSLLGTIEYALKQYEHVEIMDQKFNTDVTLIISVPLSDDEQVKAQLTSLSDNTVHMAAWDDG